MDFKTPPEPTNAAEWSNNLSAFAIAKNAEFINREIDVRRASDIARNAVAIFVDKTTANTSSAFNETTMIKCVELAKLAQSLAEK